MSEIPSVPTPAAAPAAPSMAQPSVPPATLPATPPAEAADPAAPARPGRRRRSRGGASAARPQQAGQPQPQRPAAQPGRPQRAPHPVLERLFALYPQLFGARFLPLKLGVFQELMARHPEVFGKEELKTALGLHTRSTRYLEAVAAGEMRHGLDGQPVEPVAPEHVHHAILEVFGRRQSRTKEDLRPKLRARLVQAVEASGLSREAYEALVRTPDEAAQAVLDEAFAAIAERAAKREALRRAFEASGQTVEAFAEMYGMDLAEVRRTLGAQPPSQASS